MRSDIALNAEAYLALQIAIFQERSPLLWKSRWFAGVKTATTEKSFSGKVRETVNESQIISRPCHRRKYLPIPITRRLH